MYTVLRNNLSASDTVGSYSIRSTRSCQTEAISKIVHNSRSVWVCVFARVAHKSIDVIEYHTLACIRLWVHTNKKNSKQIKYGRKRALTTMKTTTTKAIVCSENTPAWEQHDFQTHRTETWAKSFDDIIYIHDGVCANVRRAPTRLLICLCIINSSKIIACTICDTSVSSTLIFLFLYLFILPSRFHSDDNENISHFTRIPFKIERTKGNTILHHAIIFFV